jgi:hypothetical protein
MGVRLNSFSAASIPLQQVWAKALDPTDPQKYP